MIQTTLKSAASEEPTSVWKPNSETLPNGETANNPGHQITIKNDSITPAERADEGVKVGEVSLALISSWAVAQVSLLPRFISSEF